MQTIGRGVEKVSWKIGRNFCDWHKQARRRGDDITTACGLAVPAKQNVPRSLTLDGMPLETCCSRCFPVPTDQADGAGAAA